MARAWARSRSGGECRGVRASAGVFCGWRIGVLDWRFAGQPGAGGGKPARAGHRRGRWCRHRWWHRQDRRQDAFCGLPAVLGRPVLACGGAHGDCLGRCVEARLGKARHVANASGATSGGAWAWLLFCRRYPQGRYRICGRVARLAARAACRKRHGCAEPALAAFGVVTTILLASESDGIALQRGRGVRRPVAKSGRRDCRRHPGCAPRWLASSGQWPSTVKRISAKPGTVFSRFQSRCSSQTSCTQLSGLAPA